MNYLKTGILLIVLTLVLVWVGGFIGGPRGAVYALIFSLILNGVSYWYSDRIVLAVYRAYEIPKDQYIHLYNLVQDLANNADLPMPKLYMVENPSPNAFATGRSPEKACLCVTKGLLKIMEENELKGVLAHELAHVKNRDTLIMTVTASIAGAVMLLANIARWTAVFGGGSRGRRDSGNIFGLIILSILAPVAAIIVQLSISRSREYGADNKGAKIAGDSGGLASALMKLSHTSSQKALRANAQTSHLFIVNPLSGNFISNLFTTHPPIKDRVRRLREMKIN